MQPLMAVSELRWNYLWPAAFFLACVAIVILSLYAVIAVGAAIWDGYKIKSRHAKESSEEAPSSRCLGPDDDLEFLASISPRGKP